MAVVASGNVTQSANGNVLTFTDTSTGIGTLTSKTLVIYDSNGAILTTIAMGAGLTATYNITADLYMSFVMTIIDNTGTYPFTYNFLSTTFYDTNLANIVAQMGCGCGTDNENLIYADIGEIFKSAALRDALSALAVAAQSMITAANNYLLGI